MSVFNFLAIYFIAFLLPLLGWANSEVPTKNTCVSGSEKNMTLATSFWRTQNDSLVLAWKRDREQKKFSISSYCEATPKQKQTAAMSKIGELTRPMIMKKACILAALKRQNNTTSYSCESGRPKGLGQADDSGPCVTEEMADFIWWATNLAVQCVSPAGAPLDTRIIFKKFNNETGFHYFQASPGGVGLGQLTSIAIEEMNNNGVEILDEVRNSTKAACQPFKKIMNDKKLTSPINWCQHLQLGSDFGRHLIYSMSLFRHMRDYEKYGAKSALKKKRITNNEIANYLTLAMYGPKGLGARRLLNDGSITEKTSFQAFQAKVRRHSDYLRATEDKMKEVMEIMHPDRTTFTEAELKGDTCVGVK